MVKIILIRHGYSQGNAFGKAFCGQTDLPLTDIGFKQAKEVCDYVFNNYKVDAIYSSNLSRAFLSIQFLYSFQSFYFSLVLVGLCVV